MTLSPEEKRGVASVLVGAALVIIGGAVLAGLTRAGVIGALVTAFFASAIVILAIYFHAAYRRASPPPVRPLRPSPRRDERLDAEEELEEQPGVPEVFARDEREGPPP